MVDFRYHLVSLVSVFLALALGIILGAGPLQNSIGDTLSGQVETLRTSRDEARAELALTQTQLEGSEAALNLAGEQLLPGTLTDRNVALVVLPGTNADVVDGLEAELELSGAKISAQVLDIEYEKAVREQKKELKEAKARAKAQEDLSQLPQIEIIEIEEKREEDLNQAQELVKAIA